MSADIPRARELLEEVLANFTLKPRVRANIEDALSMMTRASPVTRTRAARPVITAKTRREAQRLARAGFSHHQIAQELRLRNGGRVSEILNGKR